MLPTAADPNVSPSVSPTNPTAAPTWLPTANPTANPTSNPTAYPSGDYVDAAITQLPVEVSFIDNILADPSFEGDGASATGLPVLAPAVGYVIN